MKYIGLDIGGTSIKSVLLEETQKNGYKLTSKQHSHTAGNTKSLVAEVNTHIEQFLVSSQENIKAVGLGTPGPLDSKRTKFLTGLKPQLRFLENISLLKELKKTELFKKHKLPIFWENDANLFALAESILGKGQGVKSLLGITLGTGVGGGIVFNQSTTHKLQPGAKAVSANRRSQLAEYQMYPGAHGGAGEVGHMVIQVGGLSCYCGRKGCLEQYVSNQYLNRYAPGQSVKDLHQKANQGDSLAENILREMGEYLGAGLTNLVNLIDPEIIVIGGGLMEYQPNLILQIAVRTVRSQAFSSVAAKKVKIVPSDLGNYSGAIGAALFAKQKLNWKIKVQKA